MSIKGNGGAQGGTANLRLQNRKMILEAVLGSPALTRAELCCLTGLSSSTVATIVNELDDEGYLLEEDLSSSKRGRRPSLVKINPAAGVVMGIDLNDLTGCLYDLADNPCTDSISMPTGQGIEPDDVLRLIRMVQAKAPPGMPAIRAIGISVPGRVDPEQGSVLFSANLDWQNIPLARYVSEATGLPTAIESTVICLALGEAWFGVARGTRNFIYLHMGGRGVGTGIVVNDTVVRGGAGDAGDISHMQVEDDGPLCRCGRRGCLDAVAAGRAILRRVQTQKSASIVDASFSPIPQTFAELTNAAREGDQVCLQALAAAGRALGRALGVVTLLLGPELVVFGGSCTIAADLLLPYIEKTATTYTWALGPKLPRIVQATDATAKSTLGGARIAVRQLLLQTAGR